MSQRQSKGVQEQKKKGGKIAYTIGGAVLVVAVAIGAFVLGTRQNNGEDEEKPQVTNAPVKKSGGEGTIIDESYEKPESEETVGLGFYEAKMSTDWVFDSKTLKSTNEVYIANADENVYDMYFDLVDESSDTIIYTSPVIEIGDALEELTLDTPLEPGKYTCLMVHHLLDPETDQEVDGLDLYVDIEIL